MGKNCGSQKPHILVTGFNPAWQKTLFFPSFRPGEVNRADSVLYTAGGKGIHFLRAARIWGGVDGCVFQFAGGETGKRITDSLAKEGLPCFTVPLEGETRTCTTVLCRKTCAMTELIEPSATVSKDALDAMHAAIRSSLETADALALCGTCPPGTPPEYYALLAAEARKRKRFVFADVFQNIRTALEEGVDLLKINREELLILSGETDTESAFRECFRKFRIGILAVTDGKDPAMLSEGGEIRYFDVPVVEKPVNPIGCGDTCSGVMLTSLLTGASPAEAFRNGLAAASANCMTAHPAIYDKETALRFAALPEKEKN